MLGWFDDEQYLVISTERGNRYVQFVKRRRNKSTATRLEVVSNAFLAESERLDKKQIAMMAVT